MRGKRALSAAGLAILALAGFGLGACGGTGGEGALSTGATLNLTSIAGTVGPTTPTRTRTRTSAAGPTTDPTTTSVTTTASETTTTSATTTVGETTTTAVTTTVAGPTTATTHIVTTTTTATVPAPTTTTSSETSSPPWPWIILAAALAAAALLVGLLVWHRRRSGAVAWGSQTADLNRRALVALDDVAAKGSLATGQIEALAAEARALEGSAPDDPSAAAAAQVRARLDDLAAALESDRALRLGSTPPNEEQLSYSEALIRQQLEQLQGVLRPPSPPPPSP